jgi:type IV pilus assembly protein PilC
MDLPAAVTLAGEVVGSPGLQHDSEELVQSLQRGAPVDETQRRRIMPPTIPAVLAMASERNELPGALGTLSQMYQQQADLRLSAVPVVLAPILIIMIASVIGFVIVGLFAPLITLIQAVSGPG